jgi:hypothetical protein
LDRKWRQQRKWRRWQRRQKLTREKGLRKMFYETQSAASGQDDFTATQTDGKAVFKISLFKNKKDNQPQLVSRSWQQLCDKFQKPQIRFDKDGALFSGATFDPPHRKKENVTELSLLGFDVDHDADFEMVRAGFDKLQCAYSIYTSNSHLRVTESNKNGEPRFRAVVPLLKPVPAKDFPTLWQYLKQITGLPFDENAKDASRIFYTPAKANENAPYECHINNGSFLDWEKLPLEDFKAENQNGAGNQKNFDGSAKAKPVSDVIPNGNRRRELLSIAGTMRRRGLTANEMFAALKVVNLERCKPPLDEREILEFCEDVEYRYDPEAKPHNAADYPPGDNTRKKGTFDFVTLDDLLAEPEEQTSFVWEKTLPVGGFSICSAKPKVGKSTTARNLAVCISRGEPFLGRDTLQGKVLYLCLEEKRAEVRKHFAAMKADGGEILIYAGATPENPIEALTEAIAVHAPVLVIIDPLSRVLRVRDFNDYAAMARGLEPFIDLARKLGTHILALHHDGKGDRDGGDALLGSTAIFGAVDCHIQMKKRERGRTILTTNRYGENLPETVIELDQSTGIIKVQGDLQTVALLEKQREILEAMANDEELSEVDIKHRVGTKGITSLAIRALYEKGKITRTGEGKRGNPFCYRKNPENQQNPETTESSSMDSSQPESEAVSDSGESRNEADKQRAENEFSDSGFVDTPIYEKSRNPEINGNVHAANSNIKLFDLSLESESERLSPDEASPAVERCWVHTCRTLLQGADICPNCGQDQNDLAF